MSDRESVKSAPALFVTVGTDHHPFDRLVRWIDGWLATDRGRRSSCFIQAGTSRPPQIADWSTYMAHDEMVRATAAADVVVCHAGPSTISQCFLLGRRPIVVPRKRMFGEHVDDHQTAFARRMATEGLVDLVESEEELFHLLDHRFSSDTFASQPRRPSSAVADSIERFGRLVDRLIAEERFHEGGGAGRLSDVQDVTPSSSIGL